MAGGEMPGLSAMVKGRVQGVGYRYFVLDRARALGLTGFVRNLPGGAVEVQADGAQDKLERLIRELWQGPAFASVRDVETQFLDEERGFEGFDITF